MTKKTRRKKRKNIPITLMSLSILVVMGIGVAVAASSFTAGGFKVRNLKNKIQDLTEENRYLELKATNLRSLQSLQEMVSSQTNLVPIDSINYLKFSKTPNDESVSKK